MKNNKLRWRLVLGVLSFSTVAQAQMLEEIIVTAQKREQSLQDVPIAITALGSKDILENDIRTLQDLNGVVPGLVVTNSANYSAAPLAIRGVGGANGGGNVFADEPVGVYVDDVYMGRLRFSTADLLDIGSIEVLRGPQGTLYGRNSTAGALLIRSAAPTEELEGYLRSSYTDIHEFRIAGAVSGPLIKDKLIGRLAASYSDRDGWGNNITTNDSVPTSKDTSIRGSLRYYPSEALTIDVIVDYLDRDSHNALLNLTDVSDLATLVPPNTVTPFDKRADFDDDLNDENFRSNTENRTEVESRAITLKLNWDMGWASLDSISGYRDWDMNGRSDSDGSEYSIFDNTGVFYDESYSQELRLSSETNEAFSWIIGLYYIHEKNEMSPFLIDSEASFFPVLRLPSGTRIRFDAFQNLDAYAVFANVTWNISDQISLDLGGRYSYEEKEFEAEGSFATLNTVTLTPLQQELYASAGFPLPAVIPAGFDPFPHQILDAKDTWEDFSPKVVLNYTPGENTLLYASFKEGFKSGGFNAFSIGDANTFDPEHIDAYEIGLKTDIFNSSVRLNLSAFQYNYEFLQVRLPVPGGGVNIENAAEAKVQGFEIETIYYPISSLQLRANIAFLDATYEEGELPVIGEKSQFPSEYVGVEDLSGNHLSRAPEWQFYLNANYTMSLPDDSSLKFDVSYKYQDRIYFLETNQDAATFQEDPWQEVDVRLSYLSANNKIEIALFGQNILDERYITAVSATGGLPTAAVNEPRKWGVQIQLNL